MKTRITIHRFAPTSDNNSLTRYRIEVKKHWWSRWKVRDWNDEKKTQPRYYKTYLDAINNL